MRFSTLTAFAFALMLFVGCEPSSNSDAGPPVDAGPRPDAGPPGDSGIDPDEDAGPPLPVPDERWARYIHRSTPRLVIEVDFVAGAEPRADAQADLVARLATLLDKPGGITVERGDTIPSRGADYAWSFTELAALADTVVDVEDDPDEIRIHVMWVDGHDEGDSGSGATLGLAWGNRHIAMYHDTIEDNCGGSPIIGADVCAETQYLVWLHEVGHTIGLVDNGLPMVRPHRSAENGRHDVSDDCVMYFAIEGRGASSVIRDSLLGGSLPDFDDECLADIAAIAAR